MNNTRVSALNWWNNLTNDKKYEIMLLHKSSSLNERKPSALTGREIELLYNFYIQNKLK